MFSRLNDLNLRNDLKKSLRQFYFIVGNDSFLVDTCLNLIKEAVGGETVRIDFTEAETPFNISGKSLFFFIFVSFTIASKVPAVPTI